MRHEFRRIGDNRQAVLCETKRAVTPFGGLVVLVELMRHHALVETVRGLLPFSYRSNNAIPPEHTLLAFWLGVAAGTRRFAHFQMLRCDRALQTLCGVRAFPSDDTVRNFFKRFGEAQIAQFFPALWKWLFEQMPVRSCTLDLDSTIFQRYGRQEGAERGFNRTRRNGRCHHPLIAFLSEPVLILHAWLRGGNTADNRGAVEFLREALEHLPQTWTLLGVRADSAFHDQKLCEFLETRQLPYIIVARRNDALIRRVHALSDWTALDSRHAVSEFTAQTAMCSKPRRFIVVRIQLPDDGGPRLLHVPRYDFRVFVTNRTESPQWLWHHYDQRAAIEPRISELKSDLGADDFCMREFYPTEAAMRSVLFLFNLLSWLQSLQPQPGQRRPATLRSSLFLCGAIVGRSGHKTVLYLSQSWGGLRTRKPLLDRILAPPDSTSPKLN